MKPKKRGNKPYVFRRGDSWIFRFRETVNEGGKLKSVQRSESLCAVEGVSKKDSAKAGTSRSAEA